MPLILPTRNPLAYPAGVAPGFDPSHVAARGIGPKHGFSGVANSGSFISLLTGEIGSFTASGQFPTTIAIIGPTAWIQSAGAWGINFSGQAAVSDPSYTLAAIFMSDGALAAAGLCCTGTATGGTNLEVAASGAINIRQPNSGGSSTSVMTPLIANVPFFVAVSKDGGTTNLDFVVRNLLTGQVFSETKVFTATSPAASNGTFAIGSGTSISAIASKIAAVMFAPRRTSRHELLQWAADPWSFWYPRRQIDRVGIAAASFKPYWANRNNDFAIGTGLQ